MLNRACVYSPRTCISSSSPRRAPTNSITLPSLSEGTPRTLVEARAFGCPVVATRVGGIPSSVEDGVNGLLVEPNDSAGLAAAIERVLTDEPLRQRLVAAGLAGSNEQTLEYFTGQLVEELDLLAAQYVRPAVAHAS